MQCAWVTALVMAHRGRDGASGRPGRLASGGAYAAWPAPAWPGQRSGGLGNDATWPEQAAMMRAALEGNGMPAADAAVSGEPQR